MATFNKINNFVENLAEGVHNFQTATLKLVLIANNPSSLTTYSQIQSAGGELANGNGYTQGGFPLTGVTSSQTGGTYKLDANDAAWTASGGDLGTNLDTFRYVVLYDDSATFKNVIGYWDYGSNLTIADGNSFSVQFDASNGILTIA